MTTLCDAFGSLPAEFWAAVLGAFLGGGISIFGQWLHYRWTTSRDRKSAKDRKKLLVKMLDNPEHEWRDMETLSGVIGANREETAKLLIELGARSSENGKDVWAYIKNKPLP